MYLIKGRVLDDAQGAAANRPEGLGGNRRDLDEGRSAARKLSAEGPTASTAALAAAAAAAKGTAETVGKAAGESNADRARPAASAASGPTSVPAVAFAAAYIR